MSEGFVVSNIFLCIVIGSDLANSRGILRLVRPEAKARYQHFLLGIPYMEDENCESLPLVASLSAPSLPLSQSGVTGSESPTGKLQ